jgi:hypothetical protein
LVRHIVEKEVDERKLLNCKIFSVLKGRQEYSN